MSWEGFQRFLDRTESRIALYTVVLGGGSVMSYLATLTGWLNRWGPIAWGVAFFLGAVATAAILRMATGARSKWLMSKAFAQAAERGSINPLEDRFEKIIISAPDLFSQLYQPHVNKRFHKCQIIGPGNFYFVDRMIANGCNFRFCNVVIAKAGARATNVTIFKDCQFDECVFSEITLFMSAENYNAIPADLKPGLPVISGNLT